MLKKLLILMVLLIACTYAQAQEYTSAAKQDKDSLPYKKYPTLPAFNLLAMDSSSVFNTYNIPEGKPTVLMFFSPDCEHCQKMTERMLAAMDSLKDANFYLFTPMPLPMLRGFYEKNKLGNYKNIRYVGKDFTFFFPSYYGASYVPDLAVYDTHKKFVRFFEGGTTVAKLYDAITAAELK